MSGHASIGGRVAVRRAVGAPAAGPARWLDEGALTPPTRHGRQPAIDTATPSQYRRLVIRQVALAARGALADPDIPIPVMVAAVHLPPPWAGSIRAFAADHEIAVLRLALLHVPLAEVAAVSAARIRRAEATLARWRLKVAQWHDLPPRPQAAGAMTSLKAAAAALDTPAILRLLHRVALDTEASSGSRFATFAAADRVLGLDLTYLVGKILR